MLELSCLVIPSSIHNGKVFPCLAGSQPPVSFFRSWPEVLRLKVDKLLPALRAGTHDLLQFGNHGRGVQVIALHPGTTDTPLSKPFQRNVKPEKLFSPAFTVRRDAEIPMGCLSVPCGSCSVFWFLHIAPPFITFVVNSSELTTSSLHVVVMILGLSRQRSANVRRDDTPHIFEAS